jgi:hypothetical protein
VVVSTVYESIPKMFSGRYNACSCNLIGVVVRNVYVAVRERCMYL